MTFEYDLAVVGGGIMGAWTLWLAQRRFPQARIVMIDRFRNGDGATAHSAGVLLATGRTPRERQLAAISATQYADVRGALGLRTTSADVYWVSSEANVSDLLRVAVDFTIDHAQVSRDLLQDRLITPLALSAHEVLLRGGVAISHDPASIARGLIAESLSTQRVSCIEGVGVRRLDTHGRGIALQLDDGATLHAARVVLAIGPWIVNTRFDGAVGQALNTLPLLNTLRVKKVVALHVDDAPPRDAVALFMPEVDAYLMPLPARNQWLFSFRANEWDCQPQKHMLEISARDRDVARAIIDRYLPGSRNAYRGGRVFCDAYTPDGEPMVQRIPETPGVIAGAGSGAGFRLAPGLADEALRAFVA